MMKLNNKIHKSALLSGLAILLLVLSGQSCKKDELDTTPPGKVSVTTVEPTNGGAIISYDLPSDNDILYVKAEYMNSLGNEVFKSSSHFGNSIEVDGFNDTLSHKIKLYTT